MLKARLGETGGRKEWEKLDGGSQRIYQGGGKGCLGPDRLIVPGSASEAQIVLEGVTGEGKNWDKEIAGGKRIGG